MDAKTVFFSNVPLTTSEETLLELFSECGSITQFRPFQRKRGGFRGMGIVSFSSPEEVYTAIETIRNRDVDGQPIWVTQDETDIPAEQDDPVQQRPVTNRVFFSNVPFTTTEDTLRGLFARVGRIDSLLMFQNHIGGFRGMGVCIYNHPGGAQAAVEMLRDVDVDGRPIWITEDNSGTPLDDKAVQRRIDYRHPGVSQMGQINRMPPPSQTPQMGQIAQVGHTGQMSQGQMPPVGQMSQTGQMPTQMGQMPHMPLLGHVSHVAQAPQTSSMPPAASSYGAASPYGAGAYSGMSAQGSFSPAQFQGMAPQYDSRPSDHHSRRQAPPPSEPVQEPVEVFFSNVSFTTTEETLRAVFSEAGVVLNLRLFRKHGTDESRGMGICTFETPEQARWAAKNLRERLVDDRNMWVAVHTGRTKPGEAISQSASSAGSGSRRVFFSNVPFDVTSDELREFFEEVGRVESVHIFEKEGRSKGIGICTFESPMMAAAAIRGLRDRNVGGRPIRIAEDEDRGAGRGMLVGHQPQQAMLMGPAASAPLAPLPPINPGGSRRVFFSNVPFDVDVDTLKDFFEEVGRVDHLRLFEKDGKSRGMGLCTFESPSMATAAIRDLRDRDVGGRPIWIAEDDDKFKGAGKGAPVYGQSPAPAYGIAPMPYSPAGQPMQPVQPMQPQQMAPDCMSVLPYAFPQSAPRTTGNRYQPYGS